MTKKFIITVSIVGIIVIFIINSITLAINKNKAKEEAIRIENTPNTYQVYVNDNLVYEVSNDYLELKDIKAGF